MCTGTWGWKESSLFYVLFHCLDSNKYDLLHARNNCLTFSGDGSDDDDNNKREWEVVSFTKFKFPSRRELSNSYQCAAFDAKSQCTSSAPFPEGI